MLGGLICLLLIGPALRTFTPPNFASAAIWLTVGVAMAAGTESLVRSRAGMVAGYIIGAAFAACGVLGTLAVMPTLQVATAIGLLLFCSWGIAISLRQVLTGPVVDLNRIAGAVCVYLLLAIAWAIVYLLLALLIPDAFKGISGQGIDHLWIELSYFSFVTLTTLGYGDISPLVPITGALPYLEAVIGQLYVAVLIGGLVGAHLSGGKN
jgi:hypothetical protein